MTVDSPVMLTPLRHQEAFSEFPLDATRGLLEKEKAKSESLFVFQSQFLGSRAILDWACINLLILFGSGRPSSGSL